MEWKISPEPIGYQAALQDMESRVDAIAKEGAPDCVWLLEHPPLYTGGTSAKPSDLLDQRFPVYEAGRGGEYTYHGPGQRVAYIMLNLKKRQQEPDIKKYIWQLEELIIRTLASFGLQGERREGRVGIWIAHGGTESKIAAIGVRVRHWVTYHGISINNTPDLTHFNGIVPCGIQGYGVTSLQALGVNVPMAELDKALMESFPAVFDSSVLA
ncbi:MAG: lipoyl(octanoyl) transferase LipB [Alphaproteobacteria bacterium]|nr:lipoyl(octanoyl) transferase LipB [Alphaproteobacteria bacterium]